MPSHSLKYPLQSLFEPNNYSLIINPDQDHTLHWGASAKKKKKKSTKQSSMTSDARTKLGGINIKRVLVHHSKLIQHFGSTKNPTQKAQTKYWGACREKAQTTYFGGHVKLTYVSAKNHEKAQTKYLGGLSSQHHVSAKNQ